MDMDVIEDIFEKYGIPKIRDEKFIMSTDFLVTIKDGSRIAYSVKDSRQLDERTLQLLYVEKKYWMTQKVEWQLLFKEDVNKILASNIRLLAEFYNPESVVDDISKAKHLLATKKIIVDLSSRLLDINCLSELGLIE